MPAQLCTFNYRKFSLIINQYNPREEMGNFAGYIRQHKMTAADVLMPRVPAPSCLRASAAYL